MKIVITLLSLQVLFMMGWSLLLTPSRVVARSSHQQAATLWAGRSLSTLLTSNINRCNPATNAVIRRKSFVLDTRRNLAGRRSPFAVLSDDRDDLLAKSKTRSPTPPSFAPVSLKNTQRKYAIDLQQVQADVDLLRSILHIRDFQVGVWFCSSNKIRELNGEHRSKKKATDVLSFPLLDFEKPESMPRRLKAFDKHLGDIVICPAYVDKQCQYDQADAEKGVDPAQDDRGVSKAMATQFTMQERIAPLLIHSFLHLLGHDHEVDDEYLSMVAREEEVLQEYYAAKQHASKTQQT